MAGGGRFRKRRFARFTIERGDVARLPHGPHFQALDYNPLNGGADRWFEPIHDFVANHRIVRRIFAVCDEAFARASGPLPIGAWLVEAHQFRIAPDEEEIGLPTPEGIHRDGVDWVFVALIARTNVEGGSTGIVDQTGRSLGAFTLEDTLDAVFLDDHRVWHGVTPIEPLISGTPAYRDALVVTFRAA